MSNLPVLEEREYTILELLAAFNPKNIWEIGVGQPELCRSQAFMPTGIPIKLFEPFYPNYKKLTEAYGSFPNVDIFNIAVFDKDGEIEFNHDNECSWVEGVTSPTVFFGNPPREKAKVPCCKLSRFDHGQIDVALIDVEGSEWNVISQIVSRPRLLVMEMFMKNDEQKKVYTTPGFEEIKKWLVENKYKVFLNQYTDVWFYKD